MWRYARLLPPARSRAGKPKPWKVLSSARTQAAHSRDPVLSDVVDVRRPSGFVSLQQRQIDVPNLEGTGIAVGGVVVHDKEVLLGVGRGGDKVLGLELETPQRYTSPS